MDEGLEPHPQLGALQRLLGEWEGEGQGRWRGGDAFRYRESASFSHNGKPFLMYVQRTRNAAGDAPMHTESGYWRAAADGSVEVVLAHGIGVAEIEVGRWDGNRLCLQTASLHTTPSAKHVTALNRDIEVDGGVLRYELRMSTDDSTPVWHLSAELHRLA